MPSSVLLLYIIITAATTTCTCIMTNHLSALLHPLIIYHLYYIIITSLCHYCIIQCIYYYDHTGNLNLFPTVTRTLDCAFTQL